jgi:rRNA-processing protein EBP2
MVKSDEHMKRVRAELIFEQTRQETTDERRKAREQKRYGKQVQAEKLKERTLQKKDSIKNLDKWRKQRKRDGFEDNGAAPEGFEDEKRRNKSSGGGGQHGRSTPESRQKKSFKEEKFGFGGRKRVRFFFSPESDRRFFFSRSRFSGPNSPRLAHRRVRGVLPACPDT